jgi:hypothetical protein
VLPEAEPPLLLPEDVELLPELVPPDPLDEYVSGTRYESAADASAACEPPSAPPLPLPLPPLEVSGGIPPGGNCWGFRLHAYEPATATM